MEAVVVNKPEIPRNTGFIARLCANFNAKLRLVNPEFHLSEARKTASKAQEKLENAEIYTDLENGIKDLDFLVGTKPGKGVKLKEFEARENTSVLIGCESNGLTVKALEKCDAVVHIQTGDYSSLNQSHAAAIVMSEFYPGNEKHPVRQRMKHLEQHLDDSICTLIKRGSPTSKEVDNILGNINYDSVNSS